MNEQFHRGFGMEFKTHFMFQNFWRIGGIVYMGGLGIVIGLGGKAVGLGGKVGVLGNEQDWEKWQGWEKQEDWESRRIESIWKSGKTVTIGTVVRLGGLWNSGQIGRIEKWGQIVRIGKSERIVKSGKRGA